MTTRRISRLTIAAAALAFTAVLLFSGHNTSAGPGGKGGPLTAPTNLVLNSIATTTANVSWSPSTSKSVKFSYKVRITNLKNSAYNLLATVSQTETTYAATNLLPNSPYTFTVYAVDERGKATSDSNTVSGSTLADTTPPTTPVVQATVLGPSQVQLTWAESTDDVPNNCCAYTINVNGSPYTQHLNWVTTAPGTLSVVIRHLAPGSTNFFSVSAADSAAGNTITSAEVAATTDSSNDTTPPSVPTNVHLVQLAACNEVWIGWAEASDETDSATQIEYEIYVNGVQSPLPVAVGTDFDFVYATATGDNFFTVKAVDRSGNTSAASGPFKLSRAC